MQIPEVYIYSDGGAEPNPGKGGFGVILTYKEFKKEFSQGFVFTTNNRMELMGVIFGLEQLKKTSIVKVYTDSQYVVNGIEKGWAQKWKSNNWLRAKSEKAINHDLWDRLLSLIALHQSVTFYWVKGHAGHIENERCDELADRALNGKALIEDTGYIAVKDDILDKRSFVQSPQNTPKSKILCEGNSCKKCNTSIIKKMTKKKAIRPNQAYYFEYYLFCPGCKTMYMVEDAKRYDISRNGDLFS